MSANDNKRYYWIKLKKDFFDLETIDWLSTQQNGCEYIVLYQKLLLMAANHDGELKAQIGEMLIPYSPEKIARDTKFKIDTVIVALELFKKLGLIFVQQDGVLKLPYVSDVVGYSSSNKEAMRKMTQRQKKKGQIEGQTMGQNVPQSIELRVKSIELREEKEDNNLIPPYIPPKGESVGSVIENYTENTELRELLKEFNALRTKRKKPLTVRAIKMALATLDKLATDDAGKKQIIEQSLLHCWDSFYPLKQEQQIPSKDRVAEVAARLKRENEQRAKEREEARKAEAEEKARREEKEAEERRKYYGF